MKLYKTTYTPADFTVAMPTWCGSADEASKGRTALKKDHPGCKPTTETHDVPTDKVGLLGWLNKNAV